MTSSASRHEDISTLMALLLALISLCSCVTAQSSPVSVNINGYGVVYGVRGADGVAVFNNVPYAQPPTYLLRWRDATPYVGRTGRTIDGTGVHVWCSQQPLLQGAVTYSEDCLRMAIYSGATLPLPASTPLRPVIVYIHGGSGVAGGGTFLPPVYLARVGGAVLVCVNYRLGMLSAFTSALSPDIGSYGRGNFAITDIRLALNWIQSYISNFGGDPTRVTLYGSSTGGTLAQVMMHMVGTAGLFSGIIAASGSYGNNGGVEGARQLTGEFMGILCANGMASACPPYPTFDSLATLSDVNALVNATPPTLIQPTAFQLPVPSERVGDWIYFDGNVLPGGSTIELAANPEYMRAPVRTLILSNAQEGDLLPDPVAVAAVSNMSSFISYATDLLNEITPGAASVILPLYASVTPAQKMSSQMAADVRAVCPAMRHARLLSRTLASLGFPTGSNVYFLYNTATLAADFFFMGLPFATKYSFHAMDLVLLSDQLGPTPAPSDAALRTRLINLITEFASGGPVISLTPITSSPTSYAINVLNQNAGITVNTGFMKTTCEAWRLQGLSNYAWRN